MLKLHRVLNKMPHLRYSAGFWICFDFRIYQISEYTKGSEYVRAVHKVLNKIDLDRCLAVFWTCLWFCICHGSKYNSYTRLRIKVVNKTFEHRYLTGLWICLEFWIYQCCTGFCRKQPVIHFCQASEYSLGS